MKKTDDGLYESEEQEDFRHLIDSIDRESSENIEVLVLIILRDSIQKLKNTDGEENVLQKMSSNYLDSELTADRLVENADVFRMDLEQLLKAGSELDVLSNNILDEMEEFNLIAAQNGREGALSAENLISVFGELQSSDIGLEDEVESISQTLEEKINELMVGQDAGDERQADSERFQKLDSLVLKSNPEANDRLHTLNEIRDLDSEFLQIIKESEQAESKSIRLSRVIVEDLNKLSFELEKRADNEGMKAEPAKEFLSTLQNILNANIESGEKGELISELLEDTIILGRIQNYCRELHSSLIGENVEELEKITVELEERINEILSSPEHAAVRDDEGENLNFKSRIQKKVALDSIENEELFGAVSEQFSPDSNYEIREMLTDHNIEPSEVMEQIIDKIDFDGTSKEVEIQLEPEFLGRVETSIQLEDGMLNIRFVTSDEAVKELIGAQLDQLQTNLSGQGFEQASVFVELGNENESFKKEQKQFKRAVLNSRRRSSIIDRGEVKDLKKTVNSLQHINYLT